MLLTITSEKITTTHTRYTHRPCKARPQNRPPLYCYRFSNQQIYTTLNGAVTAMPNHQEFKLLMQSGYT